MASPDAIHAARPLSHFPLVVEGPVAGAPAVADVSGSGRREIVLAAGEFLAVLRSDGSPVPGFPVYMGAAAVGPPAVADITGSGDIGILFVTESGAVHLLRGDGTSWHGFPVELGDGANASGALVDVTRDGRLEIVAGGADGRVHVWQVGQAGPTALRGFPSRIGAAITSAPVLADLGGPDGAEPVILVGAADGGLHAVDATGRPRPGFPVRTRFSISGPAAIGDISDDGVADVAFGSQDYALYVVDARGRALPGFPVRTGYRIYGGPAVVDLFGAGALQVAFASCDGKLYVVDGGGAAVPGFPVELGAKPVGGVVAADLHGSGVPFLFVATEDGRLHAFDRDGAAPDGWPLLLGGSPSGTPSLADLTGDGALELLVGTRDARLVGLRARRSGSGGPRIQWSTEGHDFARSGRRHPNPPRLADISIEPVSPSSVDELKAVWTWRHLDRLPEGDVSVRWYRDGEEVEELRGSRRVPPSHLSKGQRWMFAAEPEGGGLASNTFESRVLNIRNAPPSRPSVEIVPPAPSGGEELRARIVEPSRDPDGDSVSYRFEWLRDEEPFSRAESATVPAGVIEKGETWRVIVRPFDGLKEGPAGEALTSVANTPPTKPGIAIEPAAPGVGDEIAAVVVRPAEDIDGDEIEYRFRWTLNSQALSLDESVSTLPAGLARRGDSVSVEVAAFDGQLEGPAASAETRVVNTRPSAPAVSISPDDPRTGDELRAVLSTPSLDADGDPIEYSYGWTLDDEPVSIEGDRVLSRMVRAGQRWAVEVRASDDEGPGDAATARVVVGNTPPTAPIVVIEPNEPLPEQELRARVLVPAYDRDGDEIILTHVFSASGREPVRAETLPAGVTRKGEIWTLTVVAGDGEDTGDPAVTSVAIGNRPPPAPVVALKPREPVGGQPITAVAPIPVDPDGDEVRLLVRWQLDGVAVAELDDLLEVPGQRVRRGQVWLVSVWGCDGDRRSEVAVDSIRVAPRPPAPPVVEVRPEGPLTEDALECASMRDAQHPDGDPLEVSYVWYLAGEETHTGGRYLPAGSTRRDDSWSCAGVARAESGAVAGEPSFPVVVRNSPPSKPRLVVEPRRPRRSDELRCGLEVPARDPDGDTISYAWRWTRDGRPMNDLTGPVVPAGTVVRGESWTCEVVASDERGATSSASHAVTIGSTPPSTPRVEIAPDSPVAGEDLRCEVVVPSEDPDGASVTYLFRWYRDGALQEFAPTSTEVPGRLVLEGQVWRCGASAHDGEQEGEQGISPPVRARAERGTGPDLDGQS